MALIPVDSYLLRGEMNLASGPLKKPLPFPAERKRLGAVLQERRKAMDLTQEALGFEIDMDRTYISDIETGKRNPSLVNILKLCKALKVSATDVFGEAEL